MKESVFVEQTVQHAGVDLLLFHHLRFPEVLHRYNQSLNPLVHLFWWGGENMLEVFIGSLVDFISTLGGRDLSGEQNCVLSNQVFYLVLRLR